MTPQEYNNLCRSHWYGWDKFQCTEKERQIIIKTSATCYQEFLQEHIEMAKEEMRKDHTHQFYEPSTFYGSFREAHYHGDHVHAAHRRASNMHGTFYEFIKDMAPAPRPLPDLTFVPSKKLVEYTWTIVNTLAKTEPWAWPLLMTLSPSFYTSNWHFLRGLPFFKKIMVAFTEGTFTEEDFKHAQKEMYELVHN